MQINVSVILVGDMLLPLVIPSEGMCSQWHSTQWMVITLQSDR